MKPAGLSEKRGLIRLVTSVLLVVLLGALLLAGGWEELSGGGWEDGAFVHLLQRLAGLDEGRLAAPAGGALEVHFIDVGQGDAALIRTPQGRTILIDGGPAGAGEAVLRYLAGEALSSIDLLVGTHPHEDHLGGLIAVLENLPVGRVIDSGRIHTSQTYERYLTLIEEKGIPFEVGRAGKTIVLDPSITLKVLHPGADPGGGNLNNSSVVLGLAYGKVEFLFTGDLETEAETELLERGFCAASSTVLKVAHHGSSSSSSAEFLEAVAPVIAVISAGRDNPYGHPHAEILDRLTGVGARVYRTDLLGTIVITTDGDTITIKSESGLPAGGGVMPERRG